MGGVSNESQKLFLKTGMPKFAQLKKLLSKRLGTSIEDERIAQMLRNVHQLILPQWFLEQIVS